MHYIKISNKEKKCSLEGFGKEDAEEQGAN